MRIEDCDYKCARACFDKWMTAMPVDSGLREMPEDMLFGLFCEGWLHRARQNKYLEDLVLNLNEAIYNGRSHTELTAYIDKLRKYVVIGEV